MASYMISVASMTPALAAENKTQRIYIHSWNVINKINPSN